MGKCTWQDPIPKDTGRPLIMVNNQDENKNVNELNSRKETAEAFRELLDQAVTVEDIVAQDQCDAVVLDEVTPDDEGVRKPARIFLDRVGKVEPKVRAIAQESAEQR